jgi:hypothetical protein
MARAARDGAGGGQAELIRRANTLAALRCYRWRTHPMGVIDGVGWPGRRADRGGPVAARHPAGLRRQLARPFGYVHPSRRPERMPGERDQAGLAAGTSTDPATLRRVITALREQMGDSLPAMPGPAGPADPLPRRILPRPAPRSRTGTGS